MAEIRGTRPAAGSVPRRLSLLPALAVACSLAACEGGTAGGSPGVSRPDFPLEASVRTIHDALAAGTLTCEGLVEYYLARIEAYDDRGPRLNAILAVHPRALETAREMDRLYAADGGEGRPPPLHTGDRQGQLRHGRHAHDRRIVGPGRLGPRRTTPSWFAACGRPEPSSWPSRTSPSWRGAAPRSARSAGRPGTPTTSPARPAGRAAGRAPRSPPTSGCSAPGATPDSPSGRPPPPRASSGSGRPGGS